MSDEKNPASEESRGDIVDGRFACYEYGPGDLSPATLQIHRLERQQIGLCKLAADMLATLTLPANADRLAAAWPEAATAVESWQRQFRRFSGDSRQPIPRD